VGNLAVAGAVGRGAALEAGRAQARGGEAGLCLIPRFPGRQRIDGAVSPCPAERGRLAWLGRAGEGAFVVSGEGDRRRDDAGLCRFAY
jgi:hypothetical protein